MRASKNRSSEIEKLVKFSHMEVKKVTIFANSPNKLSLRAGSLTRQTFKVNSGISGQFSKISL